MSRTPDTITVDFETDAIAPRPEYPPKPVGVAIEWPSGERRYLAWGHPCENNSTMRQGQQLLKKLWNDGEPLLFHNGKFDLDVAETHLGLKLPPWNEWHDTLFLAFLDNPHRTNLSLKPLAQDICGIKPKERDELEAWIRANVAECQGKNKNWRGWGAYISKAPGGLVGRYAEADVKLTRALFKKLYPPVMKASMGAAYDRERRLLPALLSSERQGVPVRTSLLRKDLGAAAATLIVTDKIICKHLKVKELDIDSNEDLADAIDARGLAENGWTPTKTGKRSTSKQALEDSITDLKLLSLLRYRSGLSTCLRTFMMPWLESAERCDGLMHTTWNQVRQSHGNERGMIGARTGRISSSPNLMNVPKEFEDEKTGQPVLPPAGLPPLPQMRRYLAPPKGRSWGHRDYSQQELRIMGHFEGGVLMDAYIEDPWLDVHDLAQVKINDLLNANIARKPIKNTGFGLIYGMGLGKLAMKINADVEMAKRVKNAYLAIFPGLKDLINELNQRGREGEPMYTWGGRRYFCEEPKVIDGRTRTFEYKLLNYLIQGSAADCTKEALIRYHDTAKDGELLLTVHDEINISMPAKNWRYEMNLLKKAMESVEFEVPMLSEGAVSTVSWADLKDLNKGE